MHATTRSADCLSIIIALSLAVPALGGCGTVPTVDGADASGADGSTADGSTADGSTADGPTADGPTADGPTTDGSMPDAGPSPCTLAGGQIVFATNRDGDWEIARILADGSHYQQLTTNTWPDEAPQLSPDGTKIAWLESPTGQRRLSVMNLDGAGVHSNISNGVVDQFSSPRWAPDGSKIIFVRGNDVYRVNADGSGLTNLTNAADGTSPDWSPDGSRIMFLTNRRYPGVAANDIYVMDADGTDPAPITPNNNSLLYAGPRWSPSGTLIVAVRTPFGGTGELWKMSPTGGGAGSIVSGGAANVEWSPNGELVAYDVLGDVRSIVPAGGVPMNLTLDPAVDEHPHWAPAGMRIAFETDRDANREVYTMEADGSAPVNITNDPGEDVPGSWSVCP